MKEWEDEKQPLNKEKFFKGIGKDLEAKLNKRYVSSSRVDAIFRGNDITFFTNEFGEPITLFIGTRREDGNIIGECYVRRIKERIGDKIVKSHWDNKGKIKGSMRR
jgi:hypothetical protein